MNWLAWRQHRKQFMIGGIFIALFAALTIPTGLHFWHTYQYALSTCGKTDTCSQLSVELFQSNLDQNLFNFVTLGLLVTPILIGLFWGVPFLAREYADGTNKLVWTQGVSRRRWLTIKLIWVLVGAAVLAGVFAALNTWWSRSENALLLNRFDPARFETQGIVPIAYAVFAVSVGIAFGAWFKRIMVALGAALALLVAVMLIVVPNFVRPQYETPVSYKASVAGNVRINGVPANSSDPLTNSASLVVSQTVVDNKNTPIDWANPPKQCIATSPQAFSIESSGHHQAVAAPGSGGKALESENGGPAVDLGCLQSLGYQMRMQYQPSYRYWDFQRIEVGLYLALSVIPLGATYWLVLKRDA